MILACSTHNASSDRGKGKVLGHGELHVAALLIFVSSAMWDCCRWVFNCISQNCNEPNVSVLLYGCVSWTLNSDLERYLVLLVANAFTGSFGIADVTMSKQRLHDETGYRSVTNLLLKLQFGLYGHVTRFRKLILLPRLLAEVNPEWRRPRRRPRNSWVRQIYHSGT